MARRRGLSLRTRIVGSATGVVGAALVLGAVLFLLLFRWTLLDGLQTTAEQQASVIADRIESTGSVSLTEDEVDDDDRLLQLVSGNGEVIAAAEDAPRNALATEELDGSLTIEHDGESYLVVSTEAETESDDFIVVLGLNLEDVDESLGTVLPLVVIAVPLLLVLVAGTIWAVVGRALRPVEAMRRSVEAVTAANLNQRIPPPGGNDEIARLATTMNRMLERLDHSQQVQRRFVSDASHELRSPLASLRQYAEVATSYPDRLGAEELADAIREEGGRLEAIVRGMLVLARADESSIAGVRHDVDLDDLLLAEASRLRNSTGLVIETSGVPAGRVSGSDELLAQVVRNLVDNAARHASSRIGLTLNEADNVVTLAVDDDGPGIAAADRERVFERFFRADSSRSRHTGGSGLGLSIVKHVAQNHGGDVRLWSQHGNGSTFTIRLPAASHAAAASLGALEA